jgi:hypothetical protein
MAPFVPAEAATQPLAKELDSSLRGNERSAGHRSWIQDARAAFVCAPE